MLHLSADDLVRLEHAQTVLLSPLDFAAPAEWGCAVADAARALLGAHHASLFVSGPSPEMWFTTLPPTTVEEFLDHYAGRDPVSRRVIERGIECACAWDVVNRDDFHRSEFFNDFAAPNTMHDAMGLRIATTARDHLWMTFQHARPLPESEVRRRVGLLRLLLPAFKAGARAAATIDARGAKLASVLDRLTEPLLIATAEGRVLHQNSALKRLLLEAGESDRIHAAIQVVLAGLVRMATRRDPAALSTGIGREAVAAGRRYRITGGLAAEGVVAPAPVLLVQVEALEAPPPSAEEVKRRFGLTPREVDVALLLAERRTNREIATILGVSPHTAERHTERVLAKLAVHSRTEVAARLEEARRESA